MTRTRTHFGEFDLPSQRVRLPQVGNIPLTGLVKLVVSGAPQQELVNGELVVTTKVKVRMEKVFQFGAIEVAGPATCQTSRLSTIVLRGSFHPATGGTLNGTYDISNMTGCGSLNGLINPLTESTNNPISITLTPNAV
ncbi:MAG: hypothetical protein QM679_00115 [Patulibacter sp.]